MSFCSSYDSIFIISILISTLETGCEESDTCSNKEKLFAPLIGQPTTTVANSSMFIYCFFLKKNQFENSPFYLDKDWMQTKVTQICVSLFSFFAH